MNKSLMLESPGRRNLMVGTGSVVLSGAAVALLAGKPAFAAMSKGDHAHDAATLNTALALEHEGINAYTLGAQSNLLQKPVLDLAVKFQDDHKAHRDRLIKVIRQLGGTPVEEKTLDKYAKELGADKLKSQADVLTFAAGLEKGAVNAYLGILPSFGDSALAKLAGQLAVDEAGHFALLNEAIKGALPGPLSFGA